MKLFNIKEIELPKYTKGEELLNTVTHVIGAMIAVVILVTGLVTVSRHQKEYSLLSCWIYGLSMIILYVVLYVTAIAVSTVWDLVKYRDDWNYSAVGASGAVSAILFASILFEPEMGIYIYLIPIPVPGYIFAPLYLLYCWYMARRKMDNIGHTAHFWGAVYGLLFPLACRPDIFQHFLAQLGL